MAAEQVAFSSAFQTLSDMGFFDVVLPFLLVFAIVFGALEKTEIFGKDKRNINATIAFAIAMIFTASLSMTGLIKQFLPFVGLIAIMVVSFLLVTALFFGKDLTSLLGEDSKAVKYAILLIVAVALIYTLGLVAGWWTALASQNLLSGSDISVIVVLVVIIVLVFWMTRGGSANGGGS